MLAETQDSVPEVDISRGRQSFDFGVWGQQRRAVLLKVAFRCAPQYATQPEGVYLAFLDRVGALDDFRHDGDAAALIPF